MDSALTDASASDAAALDAARGDASGMNGPADSAVTSDGSIDAAGSDASDATDGGEDSGPDISGLNPGGDFAATRVTGVYLQGTADEIRPVSGFAYSDPFDITKINVFKVLLTDFPVTSCRVDLISTWQEESIDKHLLLCTIDPNRMGAQPGFRLEGNRFGWRSTKSWDCYINLQDDGEVSGRVTGDFRFGTGADEMAFTFNLVNCGRFDSHFF